MDRAIYRDYSIPLLTNLCRCELLVWSVNFFDSPKSHDCLLFLRQFLRQWISPGCLGEVLDECIEDAQRALSIRHEYDPEDAEWKWLVSNFKTFGQWSPQSAITALVRERHKRFLDEFRWLCKHRFTFYNPYHTFGRSGVSIKIPEEFLIASAHLGIPDRCDEERVWSKARLESRYGKDGIFEKILSLGLVSHEELKSTPDQIAASHAEQNAEAVREWKKNEGRKRKIKKLTKEYEEAEEAFHLLVSHVEAAGSTREKLLEQFDLLPVQGELYKEAKERVEGLAGEMKEREEKKRKHENIVV